MSGKAFTRAPWIGPQAARTLVAALAAAIILCVLGAASVGAAPGFLDDTPAAYLYGNLSARAIGMGGAFVTMGDSPAAALYNPAALAGLPGVKLEGLYVFFEPLRLNALGVSLGSLAVNYVALDGGAIEGRDEYDNPTGNVGNKEQAIVASLGLGGGFLKLGTNVKYLTHQISFLGEGADGKALGLDAGLLLTLGLPWLNVRLGVAARDLPLAPLAEALSEGRKPAELLGREPKGTVMIWRQGDQLYAEEIPTTLRVGLSAEVLLVTVALEVDHLKAEGGPEDNVIGRIGAQFNLGNVKLRAGAYTDPTPLSQLTAGGGAERGQKSLLEGLHLTAGIGVRFTRNIGLDYALEDSPVGLRHYLAASFQFGG